MNHITNERGEHIPTVGQSNSYARMAIKYPDTILKLIDELKKTEPLCVKVCRENNIHASEMYALINAAKYYKENNLQPLK